MKAEGFQPAIAIETLADNFQAWLNHGQVLQAAVGTVGTRAASSSTPLRLQWPLINSSRFLSFGRRNPHDFAAVRTIDIYFAQPSLEWIVDCRVLLYVGNCL
jgi:hypothetical protein